MQKVLILFIVITAFTCNVLAGNDSITVNHDWSISSSVDSIEYHKEFHYISPEDGFAPGIGILAVFIMVAILLMLVVGIGIAAIILLIVLALIAFGVTSISFLIGYYHKSITTGLRSFVILSFGIGGVLVSALVFWILNEYFGFANNVNAIITGSAISGLAAVALAYLMFYVIGLLFDYLSSVRKE